MYIKCLKQFLVPASPHQDLSYNVILIKVLVASDESMQDLRIHLPSSSSFKKY